MSRKEDIQHEMVGLVLDAFRDGEQGVTGLRNDQTAARVGRSMQRIQKRLRELCNELEEIVRTECRQVVLAWYANRHPAEPLPQFSARTEIVPVNGTHSELKGNR